MYIRKNIPEIGEFVIGTVESTKSHHVIFKLDEYNLNADLYTTEINRKEVRNFKVVFKKNRKFVLKVIKYAYVYEGRNGCIVEFMKHLIDVRTEIDKCVSFSC